MHGLVKFNTLKALVSFIDQIVETTNNDQISETSFMVSVKERRSDHS